MSGDKLSEEVGSKLSAVKGLVAVVKQLTHYPKFEGTNPATVGTGREKIARSDEHRSLLCDPKVRVRLGKAFCLTLPSP
jgi:hypothetical protein